MKVKDLIKRLQELPQEARVLSLWDGELRTAVNVAYHAKNGRVVLSDYEQVCYSNDSREINAPLKTHSQFWYTEKAPKDYDENLDYDQ